MIGNIGQVQKSLIPIVLRQPSSTLIQLEARSTGNSILSELNTLIEPAVNAVKVRRSMAIVQHHFMCS
jgi:hypothetical protein